MSSDGPSGQFIDGAWVASKNAARIDVTNPATGEVIGSAPAGSTADVDAAVAAARRAFESWSALSVDERAEHVIAMGEHLRARVDELAELFTAESGTPIGFARAATQATVESFAAQAGYARALRREERVGSTLLVREPIGVVAGIVPWNYPLDLLVLKTIPAIAAGCTAIGKPPELAPLACAAIADAAIAAELPAGVVNIVWGEGPVVGAELARHPGVDMLSFVGSTATGRAVAELAAASVKRVELELGGKAPVIALPEAKLDDVVRASLDQLVSNNGQSCMAWTRLLVPRERVSEAAQTAREHAEGFRVGDPADPRSTFGPLISERQRERVLGYIRSGIDEGATLVTGGVEPPVEGAGGHFVAPTVFADVEPSMAIAREEIFGPVLSIIGYDDEDDAVRIANDSSYGLYAAVFGGDVDAAARVARRVRAGQVDVNGAQWDPEAPFGGYRQSGNGRSRGPIGFASYFETKAVKLPPS